MFIDTNTPDLQGFDPSKSGGLALPPVGVYPEIQLQVVGSEQGATSTNYAKFDITYQIMNGEITGTQFKLTYNTGHGNPDTAKWAVQDVLRVVYAITGSKDLGRVNFDEKMHYKPFIGTLDVTNQSTTDKNGNPYRNGVLRGLKPITGQPQQGAQPAGQPQYNNNVQPQRGGHPAGQPQSGAPSWHNKG